jgi:O-antigen ligase
VWFPRNDGAEEPIASDPLAYGLIAVVLAVPVVQLIPLPPSIWSALPGRDNELAALSLIGAQGSWRPISLSPARTFASLLAIVPPLFFFYAVCRLDLHERRLVLATVVAMAVLNALLGAVQLTAGGQGVNFYPQHHVGWVTGFQANRNAAADVLLVGILALAVLTSRTVFDKRRPRPLQLDRSSLSILSGGTALFLLAATVMTGSRTGALLILVAGAGALLIFTVGRSERRAFSFSLKVIVPAAFVAAGLLLAFLSLSETTALGRVAARFSELGSARGAIWEDTWFALKQYWPVGFGLGGFQPAMLPAERLEVLDPSLPNRAHNDFLEIGLEAGALGYVMIVAAVILCLSIAWRAWRGAPPMRGQVIFGLSVLLIIALHSVVDYPLRSMAVASLAGIAGGMLVKKMAPAHRKSAFRALQEVKGLA